MDKNIEKNNKIKNTNRSNDKRTNTNNQKNYYQGNSRSRKPASHNSLDKPNSKNRSFLQNYNPNPNARIKIIPLGGLDDIGMNITIFEDDKDIIIVDCGLAFPRHKIDTCTY